MGQPVSIKVHTNEERLTYAYIYVNGKISGSTYSLEIFKVNKSLFLDGDTIQDSYVGRNSTFAIYDGAERYELNLTQDNTITPVVIVPHTAYKDFFGEKIKVLRIPKLYQETKGEFKISIFFVP